MDGRMRVLQTPLEAFLNQYYFDNLEPIIIKKAKSFDMSVEDFLQKCDCVTEYLEGGFVETYVYEGKAFVGIRTTFGKAKDSNSLVINNEVIGYDESDEGENNKTERVSEKTREESCEEGLEECSEESVEEVGEEKSKEIGDEESKEEGN